MTSPIADPERAAHAARLDALLAGQMVRDTKDQAIAQTVLETGVAEIERDARELADVEQARQRLAAGRYGRCVECDTVIPEARLEAWPTAKRCRPCQAQHEQRRRG